MTRLRPPRTPGLGLILAAVVPLFGGCSEELGPEVMPTAEVKGRVVALGKPIPSGWIEFIPADGTVGTMATARIRPDGSFNAPRVPVGVVAVAFSRLPNESLPAYLQQLSARFFSFNATPIRRKIPAQPGVPIEIDIVVEALQYAERLKQDRAPGDGRPG